MKTFYFFLGHGLLHAQVPVEQIRGRPHAYDRNGPEHNDLHSRGEGSQTRRPPGLSHQAREGKNPYIHPLKNKTIISIIILAT